MIFSTNQKSFSPLIQQSPSIKASAEFNEKNFFNLLKIEFESLNLEIKELQKELAKYKENSSASYLDLEDEECEINDEALEKKLSKMDTLNKNQIVTIDYLGIKVLLYENEIQDLKDRLLMMTNDLKSEREKVMESNQRAKLYETQLKSANDLANRYKEITEKSSERERRTRELIRGNLSQYHQFLNE